MIEELPSLDEVGSSNDLGPMYVSVRIDPMDGNPVIRDVFYLDFRREAPLLRLQLATYLRTRLERCPDKCAVRLRGQLWSDETVIPLPPSAPDLVMFYSVPNVIVI